MPTLRRTTRGRTAARTAAAALLALAPALAACSGGDDGATSASTTTAAGSAHSHGSGSSRSGFGSSMAPDTVSVAQVAALGDGPAVGDQWSGWIGLNVCGRFLEVPAGVQPSLAGFSSPGTGAFTLAPTAEGDGTGRTATIGKLAELIGVQVGTGEMTLPAGIQPPSVDLGKFGPDDADLQLAGATLRTGDKCGKIRAEVQLWVYDADSVNTGRAVRMVVTDPQDVPVVQDHMAFVIALSPESSLPTLPPAALQQPG